MTYQEKIIGLLPDSYAKVSSSNNHKLFQCISPEYDLLKETMHELRRSLDIEYASGGTLDKLATNVNQQRGKVNDVVLRTLIKAKIAADMSVGTITTLLDVIGFIIGDVSGRSRLVELWNDPSEPEPAAFQIIAPIEGIIGAGISLGQFVKLVVNIKAAGVRVVADLQGTFEFGEISDYGIEFDTGFSTDGTDGGSLGILYDPNEDDELPI